MNDAVAAVAFSPTPTQSGEGLWYEEKAYHSAAMAKSAAAVNSAHLKRVILFFRIADLRREICGKIGRSESGFAP